MAAEQVANQTTYYAPLEAVFFCILHSSTVCMSICLDCMCKIYVTDSPSVNFYDLAKSNSLCSQSCHSVHMGVIRG